MKNRFPVYLVLGVLCAAVNSAIAAPPIRERVSIRTEFRVAARSLPDLKISSYEGLKAHIAKEKGTFEEVMFRIFTEGGQYSEGGQVKEYKASSLPPEMRQKFELLKQAHESLMAEVAKLEGPQGREMNETQKLDALKQKFLEREAALGEFVKEGAQKGKFVLTEGGHWGFAETLKVRMGGRNGPGTGQQGPGDHVVSETAGSSNRVVGEVPRANPGADFGTLFKDIDKTFMNLGAQKVSEALKQVYPEGTTTGERAEKAVLVTRKAEELISELPTLLQGKGVRIDKDKIVDLIESMIRAEAGPGEMAALREMLLKFDQDAGEGLHRMAYFDMYLRKDSKGLTPEQRGELMNLWLQGGEDVRALLSPSYTGKYENSHSADGGALRALSTATRQVLADMVKSGKQFTKAEFIAEVERVLNRDHVMAWKIKGKNAQAELRPLLERAAEKLELARKNKGEDKELLAAICRGECKQHFTISCKL